MKKQDGFPGQISYVIPDRIKELIEKNRYIRDLYLTDIGYYPRAKFHYRERSSGSQQSILIYCVEGTGKVWINQIEYELRADQFLMIPAITPHSYRSDENDPWSIYWLHFAGFKASFFTRNYASPQSIERGKSSRTAERIELFNDLFRNLERGFSMENLEYVNLTLGHLLVSFTHLSQYRQVKQVGENDKVSQSINYMIENLNRKLQLEELSNAVGLSTSHFSRIFQQRTGHSPIDYFIQLKIQRSCRLLDQPGWLISDVARETGFEDQFYFSRQFRKVMGMSPANYRKKLLGVE